MAIDLTGAEAYFAADNHTKAAIWASFGVTDPNMKTAAIAQAKRTLSRILKDDLQDPTDPADLTEFPRHDFAVYEQAIFDLQNGLIADGSQANTKFVAGRTKTDEARERSTDIIAPEALRWLFRGGQVMITRG